MADKPKKQTSQEMAERELSKKEAKAIANRLYEIKKRQSDIKKLEKQIEKIKSGELVPDEGTLSTKDEDDESSPSLKVVFLLDESGSMDLCKPQTISGFNEYIQKLRKDNKNINITLTKFNSNSISIAYTNMPVSKVPLLNDISYQPDGLTPLYDAIGKTITKDNHNQKTLFIIMTDGAENDSKEYNIESVKSLIKGRETHGWSFVFLGADIDAWAHARSLGLSQGNTMSYNRADTHKMYGCLASVTTNYSKSIGSSIDNFGTQMIKKMKKKENE